MTKAKIKQLTALLRATREARGPTGKAISAEGTMWITGEHWGSMFMPDAWAWEDTSIANIQAMRQVRWRPSDEQ